MNSLTFDPEDYRHDADDQMWKDIMCLIQILLRTGQDIAVRDADCGMVTVEYNPNREEYGDDVLTWLSPAEYNSVAWDDYNDPMGAEGTE